MNDETKTKMTEKSKTEVLPMSFFEQDAQSGFDNMSSDDYALPFLRILGQLSPQCNKRDAKYVEGAEAGMIFNTVTSELYDGEKGINLLPCYYKREFVEWTDRGEGTAAPVAIHPVSSPIIGTAKRDATFKDRLPSGNYLENTASYFVTIIKDDGSGETALITMKSTQLKTSRTWNSMMNSIKIKGSNGHFTPPPFSHIYNLKTVPQSNDKGTWFGWSISKVGPVQDKEIYEQAKAFAESISKGDVQTSHGEEEKTKSEATNY
jgi:hypothetical protein|tara:strand:+ start:2003 stop:2791 length:789 start_codon:yes stop_codon:yes gene_type:complete